MFKERVNNFKYLNMWAGKMYGWACILKIYSVLKSLNRKCHDKYNIRV